MDKPQTTSKHLPKYSGKASTKIWKAINALPKRKAVFAYQLGCIIQQTESMLLDVLKGDKK